MSHTSVPDKIKLRLWINAGGRCEYCNEILWRDELTLTEMNRAYVAHIVADSPEGPRGDPIRSLQLAKELSNLMLLCDTHHRLIDHEGLEDHPEELLLEMKSVHEQRIETITNINPNKKSHILLYGANIGHHSAPLSFRKASLALIPDWYPSEPTAISLGMINSSFRDRNKDFWKIEEKQLRNMFEEQVRPRLRNGEIEHLSIFGLAPQPLLILLGYLISDIPAAETYQLHREPSDWKWQSNSKQFTYNVEEPTNINGDPVLILSLSATINNERVHNTLGENVTIWKIHIPDANNDFLKSRDQLQQFREIARKLMDRIKATHGEKALLHIFPAVPVAIAVDYGRIIMPKADLSMRIYDENKLNGGFVHALDINASA